VIINPEGGGRLEAQGIEDLPLDITLDDNILSKGPILRMDGISSVANPPM
jgi:hypothetical protein